MPRCAGRGRRGRRVRWAGLADRLVDRHDLLTDLRETVIVGQLGGTRIQPWMQAIADATGRPVEVSRVAEGAALGAAFLGRLAAGLESSIADAARWASTDRIVEPSADWAGPTKERYRRFLALSGSKLA